MCVFHLRIITSLQGWFLVGGFCGMMMCGCVLLCTTETTYCISQPIAYHNLLYITHNVSLASPQCFPNPLFPKTTHPKNSVGDDHQLLWWDTRTPTGATTTVAQAHGDSDLHTVDWNRLNPLHLATGAADGTVKIWDRRNTSSALFSFSLHQGAVMHVEWCPHSPTVLASGAEDHTIALWDLAREISPNPKSSLPAQLFFQHRGHRAQVVDFQWDTEDPWTLVSVSDDVDTEVGGGGTVQVWRVSDLLTRDRGEVLAELEAQKYGCFLGGGRVPV